MNNRILFSDNGTLKDFSVALNNYHSGDSSFQLTSAEDFIYIGARLPFNHIFIKPTKANANTSAKMKVEYWNGVKWVQVVELIDETESLVKSGHIQFVPNKDESWSCDNTNYGGRKVIGLETVQIYDRYWIRISFDQDLYALDVDTVTHIDMSLRWMGNLFSKDEDMKGEYAKLTKTKYLLAWEAGKTDWEEQHVRAGELIVQDLIDMDVIEEKGQILDWRSYILASVAKVAEIIYNEFGDDYVDQKVSAYKDYKNRIARRVNTIDKNKNGLEDSGENLSTTGFMSR